MRYLARFEEYRRSIIPLKESWDFDLETFTPDELAFMLINQIIAKNPSTSKMRSLIDAGANIHYGREKTSPVPLVFAVARGNADAVRLLLDAGADANGFTSMDEPLWMAVSTNKTDITKMLIDRGANIEAKFDGDATALHMAAYNGNLELIRYLLDAGASKDVKDDNGKTPWDEASEEVREKVPELKP